MAAQLLKHNVHFFLLAIRHTRTLSRFLIIIFETVSMFIYSQSLDVGEKLRLYLKSRNNGKAGSQTRQHIVISKTICKKAITFSYTFPACRESSAFKAVCLPMPVQELFSSRPAFIRAFFGFRKGTYFFFLSQICHLLSLTNEETAHLPLRGKLWEVINVWMCFQEVN